MMRRAGPWPSGILILCLAACKASHPVVDAADPFRLAAGVAPLSQQLTLRLDPAREDYSGTTAIRIHVGERTARLRLHAQDLDIRSLSLMRDGRALPATHEFGDHGLLFVDSPGGFDPGTYELRIDFDNDFNTDGTAIFREEQDGSYYLFSQFEPIDARRAFPCFDEPGFKFPWQLTISVPDGISAVTNTPEESTVTEHGWTTTTFASTPPLPSYLIAVAAGPFEFVPIEGLSVPGRVVVPRGKKSLAAFAASSTPPLLAFLENYFGEPFPYRKLDLIAIFGGFPGAMEHAGAITYSDQFLLLDDSAGPSQKGLLTYITAHEMAHQWFGDLVTMQWWDDLWLNESFADWMADKTLQAVYPEYGKDPREQSATFQIMDSDARPTTKAIRRQRKSTDDFFEGVFLAYYKGKAVLTMFEKAVGEDAFRDGVVRYLRKFRYGNASAADLWAEIDAGTDAELAGGLRSFIDEPGIPLVSVSTDGRGKFDFSQRRLLTSEEAGVEQSKWIIPVAYKYRVGAEVRSARLVLGDSPVSVELGKDVAWILPNADQTGYFRWNVPQGMLERLGGDAGEYLTVFERVGLLSNLWALLSTRTIDAANFLEALDGMSADADPSVLSALLDQLGNVRKTFVTPELRGEFSVYVRRLLQPALDRFGTDSSPDDGTELSAFRPQLLLWLDDAGRDTQVRHVVDALVQRHLDGELPMSDDVSVALRAAARRGNQALFDSLTEAFEAEESPATRQSYLRAIGSFRDPAIAAQALEFTRRDSLRRVDITTVLAHVAAWPDNDGMLLDWLMAHDAELRKRLAEEDIARVPDMLTVCSPDTLPAIKAFYGAPERAVPGIDQELRDDEAEVTECWNLRQRELPVVSRFLENAATS
jgi:aminopeptidase N